MLNLFEIIKSNLGDDTYHQQQSTEIIKLHHEAIGWRMLMGCLCFFMRAANEEIRYRLHPLYDSRGRLLGTLEYNCDCLKSECPGCHLPCRRCHSTFCGASCRIYRTYRVTEVRKLQELVFDY
ncbi:unnamed protein product [Schistosoma mattheei]|uniref:Uncharacterized protein n=1 Tax=Schistosoma mattheei TaxID=31246 RepID=A0A183NPN8_9TREM|nr:unnamed protein product [Schistosoma mattheei]